MHIYLNKHTDTHIHTHRHVHTHGHLCDPHMHIYNRRTRWCFAPLLLGACSYEPLHLGMVLRSLWALLSLLLLHTLVLLSLPPESGLLSQSDCMWLVSCAHFFLWAMLLDLSSSIWRVCFSMALPAEAGSTPPCCQSDGGVCVVSWCSLLFFLKFFKDFTYLIFETYL